MACHSGGAETPSRAEPSPARRGRPETNARPEPTKPTPVRKRPPAKIGNRPPRRFRIRFFSAGHGDSILMRTPGGHAVLVDAGRGSAPLLGDNLARRRLVPFFRAQGVRRLDAFIVSHPHWDHFGDPGALHQALGVTQIHVNVDGKQVLGQALPAFVPGLKLVLLHAGRKLRFGKLLLEVLHPAQGATPATPAGARHNVYRTNNRSLVIRATYGRHRFLLTGDLMRSGELRMLARGGPGRADVLKLGHHGIKSANPAWLRAVRPQFAVASLGAKWKKRFDALPNPMRRQLARRRIKLLRTDQDGDVVFISDGKTLTVETYPELTLMPDWAPKWAKKALRRKRTAKKTVGR